MLGAAALGMLKLMLGTQTLIDNSLVLGIILILVVLLVPRGFAPAFAAWRERRGAAGAGRQAGSGGRRRRRTGAAESR
jgi:branched-chain amino acid transport system permease protein